MLKKTQSPHGMVQYLLNGHTSCTHFSHSVVEFTKVLTQVNVKFLDHSLTDWLHSISTWVLGL